MNNPKSSGPRSLLHRDNRAMVVKLLVITAAMFAFGYGLVPMYRAVCAVLGINVLASSELTVTQGLDRARAANTQVDTSRTITVEFDANARGVWAFAPAQRSVEVHPGELTTVMYEFRNTQDRAMTAQAIPSYAPKQATPYFNKLECFCFSEYQLQPGEVKEWPVVFMIDPKLPKGVSTITLSYTFFEVGGRTPPAPQTAGAASTGNWVLAGAVAGQQQ